MVDKLSDLRPGDIVFAGPIIFKIHRVTKYDKGVVERESIELGCKFEAVNVKTVPPTFTGGELSKDMYRDYGLFRFVSGDWGRWASDHAWSWGSRIDVTNAAVGPGQPIKKLANDLKHISKLDLLAYLIKVHGPSTKDDLLRMAAAIEGGPWVPTSNQEYFSNVKDAPPRGFLGKERAAVLTHAGKCGRKSLYGLGPDGETRADMVLERLGEGPALQAK